MADTLENRVLESLLDYAKSSGASFVIANALLQRNPIIYCSQSFSRETGFTRSEVTRKDAFLYFLCGNLTSLSSQETLKNAVLSKSKTQIEMILYNVAGFKKWYLVSLLPVKNSNKVVSLLAIFFHDISYIKAPLTESPKRKWKKAVKKILNKTPHKVTSPNTLNELSLPALVSYYDRIFIPDYGCKQKLPKYIINHSCTEKVSWDYFILTITFVYTAVIIPFDACFNYKSIAMTVFDLVCNVFVIIDIAAAFFTSFVDKSGNLVTNAHKIKLRYLKTWFAFDIISALPYGVLDYININSKSKLIIIIRVVKVFRLVRLVKVKNILAQYLGNGVITLVIWILFFCLCSHWMACIWFLIATFDLENQNTNSWVYCLYIENTEPFQNDFDVNTQRKGFIYISALYYTLSSLTTCGFGNIAPNTFAERIFGVVTMVFGCLMYAFIFGQVTNIISQLSKTKNEYTSQLRTIRQFNAINKIPKKVCKRAENYFIASWVVKKGTEKEKVMSKFPLSLQSDLCLHIHKNVFKNEPAFRFLSKNALRALSRCFWTLRTSPGDKIIYQEEIVTSIYFVTCGSFEVKETGNLIGLIAPFDSFGLRPVMESSKSKFEVRANSFGEIHGLRIDSIIESLSLFPEERDLFIYAFQPSFDITKKRKKNLPLFVLDKNVITFKDKKRTIFEKSMPKTIDIITEFERKSKNDQTIDKMFSTNNLNSNSLKEDTSFRSFSSVKNLRNDFYVKTKSINEKTKAMETEIRTILSQLEKT
ncbi:potassium voltage-gated channel subfamily H member 1 isoform X1 [Hydra vulgaris]|uniref:potassium voltage-gated channel subfamily H member 1 isoform X1 n=1 Tax=Hydra vulgaris TaxID=6087 RepID=UPI001F5E6275|nr:potassium voltage-gated channel subfamily H member 1 isoform X1 [Hydra vulgaris]XP_047132758.1 potassium voltage-gated channel subfamily H member 1 isoform X1 [Hydra vulgaris]